MKLILWIVLGGILSLGAFWLYRAQGVVSTQLGEFAPTAYHESAGGQARLAHARETLREVGWTLRGGDRQVAWYAPPRNGAVILYAHGSPGNGLAMLGGEAERLIDRGYGALLVDLPGYGLSQGRRAWDESFVESFRRGVDFAIAQPGVDSNRIAALGYSNGGCVVARAAAEDERLAGIILLAAYTNLSDQLRFAFHRRTPFLGDVAIAVSRFRGVPVDRLDTEAALRRMRPRPTLVVWGGSDRAVPDAMGMILKSAVPGAEGLRYANQGHLDFTGRQGRPYIDALDAFLAGALAIEGTTTTPSPDRR